MDKQSKAIASDFHQKLLALQEPFLISSSDSSQHSGEPARKPRRPGDLQQMLLEEEIIHNIYISHWR
ncbi:hypothetical protein EYF80_008989 [Liparis tanakae]|uniref:Uncharacterized protein n=1 Tax=Liparis tanakae TaxID=230148 RepID=A0A4Z2IS92_9TELE|nr:hypothetical protein EYF80_008989 [Liparis tanakae]